VTIICNATPLINFAAITRLDILQATFDRIIIPQAVYDETTGLGFPGTPFVLQAIASGWLQVRPVTNITSTIPKELDNGEREAIALAIEISERRILLDEREARQIAQRLGLQVMGTLGILLLAKNNQTVPQVRPIHDLVSYKRRK
jgi:predicted nucleic acid-binding protein